MADVTQMGFVRQALSDDRGLGDIAYASIAILVAVMAFSVVFLCGMSAMSYWRCTQIVDVGQGTRAAVPCPYDPNPLGLAIAACLAAFGSPISALALYMNQTRRLSAREGATTTTAAATVTTVETPPPALLTKGTKE